MKNLLLFSMLMFAAMFNDYTVAQDGGEGDERSLHVIVLSPPLWDLYHTALHGYLASEGFVIVEETRPVEITCIEDQRELLTVAAIEVPKQIFIDDVHQHWYVPLAINAVGCRAGGWIQRPHKLPRHNC